jgi:dipeptidyl aminopeptidase/acylaminoacyl peptidase
VEDTRLPLDVNAYRITPDGSGAVVSLAVFPECKGDEIACTVKKNADRAADKASGTVYTSVFVRHWDTWADGTRNHLFYVPFAKGAAVALTDGYDGDVPSKPFGDEASVSQPIPRPSISLRAKLERQNPGAPTSTSTACLLRVGRAPTYLQRTRRGMRALCSRRTERRSRTKP